MTNESAMRDFGSTPVVGWLGRKSIEAPLSLPDGIRRLAAGHFSLKPVSNYFYTLQSLAQRVTFDVPKPTAVWWNRL
jgi:hypothetical protein